MECETSMYLEECHIPSISTFDWFCIDLKNWEIYTHNEDFRK